MASKNIGVEIGNDSLKLAVLSDNTIERIICRRMPENLVREGAIVVPEALTALLADIRKTERLPKSRVSLVLPPQSVIAHSITMPAMSDEELRLNLPYEFRDYLGQDSSRYHYDYALLKLNRTGEEVRDMELFAAAVKKELIERYYTIFKRAGFTLKVAAPAEMMWQNLVRRSESRDHDVCILDFGNTGTTINIYHEGVYCMGRRIDMGSMLIDAAIAAELQVDNHTARKYKETNFRNCQHLQPCMEVYDSIALEVMKVLSFYRYDTQRDVPIVVYYAGGGARIQPLCDAVGRTTGVIVNRVTRIIPGEKFAEEDGLCGAIAVGAGLQDS